MYEMTADEQAQYAQLKAEADEHLENMRIGLHTWCVERMRALRNGDGEVSAPRTTRPSAIATLRLADEDMRSWLAEQIRDAEQPRDGRAYPGPMGMERARTLREVKAQLVELGLISGRDY